MTKVTKEMALRYHEYPRRGKTEVVPTKPHSSQLDLSLAYSPGVAYPCTEIEEQPSEIYRYTNKGNLIGVVSNGTAVLGLGDIGAKASKPVMEGKALLFKIFAGLDAFDIEIDEKNPDKFVDIVKGIAPTFGGINLEDIKAPECFEIERRLREECDIPIMHDDQHGTAIISAAGLLNALEIQGKKIENVRLVVNGAGAAAISCTSLYVALGVKPENIVMCDSKGVIRSDRQNLSHHKKKFATSRDIHTLADAMKDADVFLGLSVKDVVTQPMLKSMAEKPIVFALANPDSEISYDLAMATRSDLIFATGRSDLPNQINNVLGFPYIFRGALDSGATEINEAMKIAAVKAIADLAREAVPAIVDEAYGSENLKFGPQYILPKPLDPRLLYIVAPAVAKAAHESGVACRPISDFEAYEESLLLLMGKDVKMMRGITEIVKRQPKRVVFSNTKSDNVLEAASDLKRDKICIPVLLGCPDEIMQRAKRLNIDLEGVEIIDFRADSAEARRNAYAKALSDKLWRDGVGIRLAKEKMLNADYFAMMMLNEGDSDALVSTTYAAANSGMKIAREVIGLKDGYSHFAAMHILHTRKGTFFLADTAVNAVCEKDCLVDIVRLANEEVKYFMAEPAIAVLSYSNFGTNEEDEGPRRTSAAVALLHEKYPDICVDGEMQVRYALDNSLRDSIYPLSKLVGKKVNTLVFPNLCASNVVYQMMTEMHAAEVIGPIQIGLRKPAHFVNINATARDIVNVATIAALDACSKCYR